MGNMMKLWVDDEREAPDPTWLIARSVRAATELLSTGLVSILSLDHDLGNSEDDGYEIVKWLESRAHHGERLPSVVKVHSMNPVGRQRIADGIDAIRAYMESA